MRVEKIRFTGFDGTKNILKQVTRTSYLKNNASGMISFGSRYDDDYFYYEDHERIPLEKRLGINSSMSYSTEEVKIARKCMDKSDSSAEIKKYQKEKYEEFAQETELKQLPLWCRAALDVVCLGVPEVVNIKNKIENKSVAATWAERLKTIIEDLKNAKLNEQTMATQKSKDAEKAKAKYLSDLNYVKMNELYPILLDKIQAKREGRNVEVPNCVLVAHSDSDVNKALVDFCLEHVNGCSRVIDPYKEDLVDVLESAEEKYQETGAWNLIYVKGMDALINPNKSEKTTIASMKAIMCSTAEDYHTTLVFTSTVPEELDDIAVESNRVTAVDVSRIESVNEAMKRQAKKRLNDQSYSQNYPLSAINDLLTLIGKEYSSYHLNFDSTQNDFSKAKKIIENNMKKKHLEDYAKAFETACSKVWFLV